MRASSGIDARRQMPVMSYAAYVYTRTRIYWETYKKMDVFTRRAPLRRGRRIPVNLTLSPETHRELAKLGRGNRSAAVEELVRRHLLERAQEPPEPSV